ncbi:alpha-glucosidase [Bacillus daqingensis]|uniref:Alpha-glucosidase n=1 Tax=Bacillus daqingensis TaxID=872396 RepID=A0ABV9P243_9BACI
MTQKWWQDAVVYQVYPKSFQDSNGDGIGDLQGVIQKLDYLQDLGIRIIWLSPVYASPMDDNGYDISDYRAIAAEFGTMADMEELLTEAKMRGMEILMDLVINHSSDEHAWFQESRQNRTNSKHDWYIWCDPREDGTEPNNLRSIFGGSCWEFDEARGQYYFHSFSKKQPDLNWENPEVRKALYDMINWWLEKGIAGFRVDAITFIKKNDHYADVVPDAPDGTAVVKPNNPGIGEFLMELKQETFDRYDALTVAEAPGVPLEQMPEFVGEEGYFSMLIEFDHVDLDIDESGRWYRLQDWNLLDFKRAIAGSQEMINRIGWSALYLENHDQPRSLNKFIPEADHGVRTAKLLAVTYFLLRGTPFIYQGQELGMTNVSYTSIEDYNDLSTIDQYQAAVREGIAEEEAFALVARRSRDNSRTPMQWSEEQHGGFSSGHPWLAANPNYAIINAEQAVSDEASIFHFYKQLTALRRASPYKEILVHGTFEHVNEHHPYVFSYKRILRGKVVMVICSFSAKSEKLKLPHNPVVRIIGNDEKTEAEGRKITLKPYEAVVFECE